MTGSQSRGARLLAGTFLLLTAFLFSIPFNVNADEKVVRIAAASSMRFVLDDLIAAFHERTPGVKIQPIYGSSGNLYRQIRQGAPYDLFLSADVQYIDDLESQNSISFAIVFALGTLVLHSRADVPDGQLLPALTTAVHEGKFLGKALKIAIGNPAHAPFGKAAKQVMERLGLWSKARPYLIFADNVSQAAQFARTGAVDFAFVARSLSVQLQGRTEALSQDFYTPIRLKLGVLTSSAVTHSFIEFMQSDASRARFNKYQLQLPPVGHTTGSH